MGMDWSGYHIITIPEVYHRVGNSHSSKGNGGQTGRVAGHDLNTPLHDGSGCLRHNIADCETCPLSDCDYDENLERQLRKRKRDEENGTEPQKRA